MSKLAYLIVAAALFAAVIALVMSRGKLPEVQGETQVYDKPPR